MKTKIIPIILYGTKIGNVVIDKTYLDILECDKINLNLEYKKSNNGYDLLNLLIEVNQCKQY